MRLFFCLLLAGSLLVPFSSASHIGPTEQCVWVQAPIITTQQELRLWGFAPNDIWAVTRDPGGPAAGTWQHYDGASWTEYQTTTVDLIALWGANSLDMWAGSATTLFQGPKHYTGTTWADTTVSTPGSRTWRGFWGPSATEVYGVHSTSAGTDDQRIYLWDGLIWTLLPTAPMTKGIFEIWGFSSNDIWITGNDGVGGNQFLTHYNGVSWSDFTLPVGYVAGGTVWGAAANDVWASAIGTPSGALHIVDGVGQIEEYPAASGGGSKIFGTSTDNVYFGRDAGTVFHWDGTQFSVLDNADGVNINAVWAADMDNVWLAGNSGYLAQESCHPCTFSELDALSSLINSVGSAGLYFIILLGVTGAVIFFMVGKVRV